MGLCFAEIGGAFGEIQYFKNHGAVTEIVTLRVCGKLLKFFKHCAPDLQDKNAGDRPGVSSKEAVAVDWSQGGGGR